MKTSPTFFSKSVEKLNCKKCRFETKNYKISKDDTDINSDCCTRDRRYQRRHSAQDYNLIDLKMTTLIENLRASSSTAATLSVDDGERVMDTKKQEELNVERHIMKPRRESFLYKCEYSNMIDMSRSVSKHSLLEQHDRSPDDSQKIECDVDTSLYRESLCVKNSDLTVNHCQSSGTNMLINPQVTSDVFVNDAILVNDTETIRHTSKSQTLERRSSGNIIVTPFAQILASLQQLKQHFCDLVTIMSNEGPNRSERIDDILVDSPLLKFIYDNVPIDKPQQCTTELSYLHREFDWCLKQLENIKVNSSIGHLASNKFQHLLNHELDKLKTPQNDGQEIRNYITSFIEREYEIPLTVNKLPKDVVIDQNLKVDESIESVNHACCSDHDKVVLGKMDESKNEEPSTSALPQNIEENKSKNSTCYIFESVEPIGPSRETFRTGNDNLPRCGMTTEYEFELKNLLNQNIDRWGIEIFEVNHLSQQHPLLAVTYKIFQKRSFCNLFEIPESVLLNFVGRIEENYLPDVSYHCATHAADVTQSAHVLLNAQTLEGVFTDIEMFAVIVASVIHDVHHPGVTNLFLMKTGHPLAILYNDSSILENHHLSVAFKILREPNCDIFLNLSLPQRQTIRKIIIDLVLATDMSKHMSLLADLKTLVETKKVASSGILNLDVYSDRIQILQNLVHCADLSNPTKPLHLYRQWTSRIMEEFFHQGDMERDRDMELSPMCDRFNASVEKSQVSFIDFIVHPLWETWSDLVHPSAQYILDHLEQNRSWYSK